MFLQKGYSTIELMVYLLILSVSIAIALPALHNYNQHVSLKMAASEIQMFLMRQKFLALSTNKRCRIHFVSALNGYYAESIDYHYSKRTNGPLRYLPREVFFSTGDIKGPPAHPRKTPKKPITFPHGFISVGPDGMWSTPGTIYLSNEADEHAAVSISIAGRIRLWWWDNEKHKWI